MAVVSMPGNTFYERAELILLAPAHVDFRQQAITWANVDHIYSVWEKERKRERERERDLQNGHKSLVWLL